MHRNGLEQLVEERTAQIKLTNVQLQEEIAEREQIEEELRQYAHIVFCSRDMQALLDRDFVYLAANAAYLQAFGKSPDEVIGRTVAEVFGQKVFSELIKPRAERCMAGVDIRFEDWFGFPVAGRKYMDVAYSPYFGPDEKVWGFVVTARDITERKRAEDALRESEERYRVVTEASLQGTYQVDTQECITFASPVVSALTGYSVAELDGVSLDALYPPVKAKTISDANVTTLRSGKTVEGENAMMRKDGGRIDTHFFCVPVFDENGEYAGFVGSILDITERKRIADALREGEERYRVITEASLQGTYQADAQGRLTFVSPVTAELSGYSLAEMDGLPLDTLYPPGEAKAISDANVALLLSGKPIAGENVLTRKDGSRIDTQFVCVPQFGENGEYAGFVGSILDITERNRVERARDALLCELQRSNEALDEFGYVVSHDLQEPLRTITNYLHLLERRYTELFDDKAREFMEFVTDGAARMRAMILSLLAYARVDTEGREFALVECGDVVSDVLAGLEAALAEAGGQIQVGPLPSIAGDRHQLAQLFQNLIGNALKFHGEKPPHVEVSALQEGNQWVFTVQDKGIGFASEFAKRIFRVFRRLHAHGEYAGTGIGLSVCRKIVERHGGRIWAESEPGQGAIFRFSLPIDASVLPRPPVTEE